MQVKMQVSILLLTIVSIVSDVPITRPVDYHALFVNSSSMALEQSETGKTRINLMNCGDYSGCTLVRIVGETSRQAEAGERMSSTFRTEGIVQAILHVRKRASAPVFRP